jgi:PAS domain S-box-containing protein
MVDVPGEPFMAKALTGNGSGGGAAVTGDGSTLFRRLFDGGPYGMAIVGSDFRYVQANDAFCRLLGYSREELAGLTFADITHPDDASGDAPLAAALLSGEIPSYQREKRYLTKSGEVIWVNVIVSRIAGDGGEPPYAFGVVEDITERKRTELALQEAEERYRRLVEQVPVVVYEADPATIGEWSFVGPRIEQMLGYTPEEWKADHAIWVNRIHPDDRARVLAEEDTSRDTVGPFSTEYRMVAKDGRVVWVRDEGVMAFDDRRGRVWMQGVMSDITERRKAEEALRDAYDREREVSQRLRVLDEMKSAFLTAVSHELRTPLSSVLGVALTLEREDIDLSADDTHDLLRRLAVNARKLERLLSDLLDLDRLSRGILEPNRRPTEIGSLVRQVVQESEPLAGREVVVEVSTVVVNVDGSKVERIIENLLANAAKYTPSDAHIWVRLDKQDGGVLLTVEDDGPGIPDDLKEAIFETFRQGPNVPAHAPGVGVGLSLVARFAELHGGRAWVEDRPGGGASFRVFLPGSP